MAADLDALRERLRTDSAFYARHCLRIVDKRAQVVPLEPRPAQLKVELALEAQRRAGKPQRVIVLKSRKTGVSTWVMGKMIQRTTLQANRRALIVAQDGDTGGELFGIGERMYARLPEDSRLRLKPIIRNQRHQRSLLFGEPSREARRKGEMGLDSLLRVDTANEVQAGRGFTYHDLHLSEVAFWPDVRKMVALLNAVPDEPNTMIVKESTANGYNHFRADWKRAERGESEYAPVFISWLEDPDCWRPFSSDTERESFAGEVGTGPYGEDEPGLVEMGASLEQLAWRRWAIANKTEGDLDTFHQEYPSTPEEAFLGTGRPTFDRALVARVVAGTQLTDPVAPRPGEGPEVGVLLEGKTIERRGRHGKFDVPVSVQWADRDVTGFGPRHAFWRVWERPRAAVKAGEPCPACEGGCEACGGSGRVLRDIPAGRYVLCVDPMSGEEDDLGTHAWHALQVIDHRTKRQVAEYRSRLDPDLIAREAFKAGLYFNEALVVVEVTGGYGWPIVRTLHFDLHYRRVFMRKAEEHKQERQADRLGWETNRATKPSLEAGAKELLREGSHGIRSRLLAEEMTTYVMNSRGLSRAEAGANDDLLMSWMIAQHVAQLVPAPSDKKPRTTTATRPLLNERGGY